jgi:hypothetical protein
MLIGRSGKFTLISPFSKLGNEIQGKIVELSYIQHEVSTGVDVENRVYAKAGAGVIYSADLRENVLLVTFARTNGSKITIPDKYIEGLYDNNLNYATAYLTVKIGSLPLSFEFTSAKEAIARGVRDTIGVDVLPKDISVSMSGSGMMLSVTEAAIADGKRQFDIKDNISDYGKNLQLSNNNSELTNKISSLENAILKISKFT